MSAEKEKERERETHTHTQRETERQRKRGRCLPKSEIPEEAGLVEVAQPDHVLHSGLAQILPGPYLQRNLASKLENDIKLC